MRSFVSLFALLFSAPVLATGVAPQEEQMLGALMGWAVSLSSYPAPERQPTVEFVPQRYFDTHACGGRHCHVWGWYPNTGQDIVYVREDLRQLLADGSDPRSLVAASIVVHEFVHYLQATQRNFAPYDCGQALALEREAYQVQTAYLQSYGRYFPVGLSMHSSGCAGNASTSATHEPASPLSDQATDTP